MSLAARICAFVAAALLLIPFEGSNASAAPASTFSVAGVQATNTLFDVLYAGNGLWRDCNRPDCRQANSDWGTDSATNALYMRWVATHDAKIRGTMAQLVSTAHRYPAPCSGTGCPSWSDTPAWDAVTLMREYEVLGGDPQALSLAQAAFRYAWDSQAFTGGACPAIPFQQPQPSNSRIKTIETDANEIKAALLLYRATLDKQYLSDAMERYAIDRRFYLDPDAALYSVHVIDDGEQCQQVTRRFFASVNGDMIWNGLELWQITRDPAYYDQAVETAHAVDANLSDGRGVFADLQGENDVVEPLVEAMYRLATGENQPFAHDWIVRNAGAALSARAADGTFSRYFDGPTQSVTSVWESNGGLALEIAAAALEPAGTLPPANTWSGARVLTQRITTLPATIVFDASGIALVGTMSRRCEDAHVRVFIDGVETFDRTGLWQNPSMPGGESVLFAWRWAESGTHTIRLEPGDPDDAGEPIVDLKPYVVSDAIASTVPPRL